MRYGDLNLKYFGHLVEIYDIFSTLVLKWIFSELKFDMAEAKKKHDEDMSKLNSDILKQAASLEKLNREVGDQKTRILIK